MAWGLLDSFSAEVATSAVGEVGEPGDGAVLPGTTLEVVVFTSVSTVMKYFKNEEHEYLRLIFFLKKILLVHEKVHSWCKI